MPIDELTKQLDELYAGCGHEHISHPLPNLVDDLPAAIEAMLLEIYALQGTDGTINQAVTKHFADRLWKGVTDAFGGDLDDFDYDTPDFNMLKSLKENVYHFSSAKNYHQLRALSDALLDENGELRTFQQFKEAARAINEKFVKSWLQVEYDLAFASGQMASKWVDITENMDALPLIQFDVVMDKRTTEICAPLAGIIVPVGHPMVKRFYPPNHFNCRTTVRQLPAGQITPDDKMALPELPKMFRTNLAQTGLIFPEGHAYFIDLPDEVRDSFKP